MKRLFMLAILVGIAGSSLAAEENCKLVVHTYCKDKKALKVEVIAAESYEECRIQAHLREVSSDPDEQCKIKADYGWRNPDSY